MGHKLITQSVLIIISLVIIFMFIKPTFGGIEKTQDKLQEYTATVEKTTELNAKLDELIQKENRFSQQEMRALEEFLPSSVDDLNVMRDIVSIFSIDGVEITSLSAKEGDGSNSSGNIDDNNMDDVFFEGEVLEDKVGASYKEFDIVLSANYQDMKNALLLLESNKYLLEITKFDFGENTSSGNESGVEEQTDLNKYSLTVQAYALTR